MLISPQSKSIMIGIYLDEADEENGALRIVPGSHLLNKDICQLQEMEYVSIDMQPGDILVHDLMVAHSSSSLTTKPKRRVVYFEFMSGKQVMDENVYTEEFVALRTRLIPLAMHVFQKNNPQAISFKWNSLKKSSFTLPADISDAIIKIYAEGRKVKAANYCFDFTK